MKTIKLFITLSYLGFMVSCGSNPETESHSHEGDAAHTHESDTTHIHEEDAAHTHEEDAAHTHEEDATHTHEEDATVIHEEDASDTHEGESDAAHTHEGETEAAVDQANSATQIARKTLKLSKQNFNFVKKTSGMIMVDKKDEVVITAKTAGIVRFRDHFLYPGLKISKGETLFSISGENLTENNSDLNYAMAEATYLKAKSNYDRALGLIDDKLITQEHFVQTRAEYTRAEAEYSIYKSADSKNSSLVKSPEPCYLKDVFITEGEMVEAGDKLASVLVEHKMVLRADIPPSDFQSIDQFQSAKFATGYSNKVYNTEMMHGNKISYGKSTGENSFYIPVYFSLDYTKDLIPGTFADVWIMGKELKDVIVIPNNAILEEYGKFYVYIDHGDHFDKRFISTGDTDGEFTHIIAGLSEAESIVTEGVYQVKMSMMTSIPNTHDHSH